MIREAVSRQEVSSATVIRYELNDEQEIARRELHAGAMAAGRGWSFERPARAEAEPTNNVRPARIQPSRRDVRDLTDDVLFILRLYADGLATGAVADKCRCHRTHAVRVRNWLAEIHGVRVNDLRHLRDASPDGIRKFITGAKEITT